uniref:ProAM N-terminal 20 peptide n=1 Tax=Neogobius melanostomus TaxID=47308 RepID=A0A8C6UN97_9GOBI
MEIAILMLLIVPFTAAVPITSTQSADSAASDDFVQLSERAEGTEQVQHAPNLNIIPFLQDDNQQIKDALKHSMALRLRPRRALQRGCQLGTCQLHNLANTLYHISKTNGKDESKKASDPQGYGR